MKEWFRATDNPIDDVLAKPKENLMMMRAAFGVYFSSEQSDADRYGENKITATLNIKKPLKLTQHQLDEYGNSVPAKILLKEWQDEGFDGIIIKPIKAEPFLDIKAQPEQAVVFDEKQITIISINAQIIEAPSVTQRTQKKQQP
jgi:hypothetical protein